MDDLHLRLREETRTHHTQIEQAPLLKNMIDGGISLQEYQLILQKFHGYIAPCENIIEQLPCRELLAQREKRFLLEEDLAALTAQPIANITRCETLPTLCTREQVLGYLYVMEGSTLGGQIIAKILQKTLQLTPEHGAKYFYGYGKKTKSAWDSFCLVLSEIKDIDQQNKVIHSANLTYTSLYNWMISSKESRGQVSPCCTTVIQHGDT